MLERAHNVSRLQNHSLGLVKDVEVENRRRSRESTLLHTAQLVAHNHVERIEEVVTHLDNNCDIREVLTAQHLADSYEYSLHLIVHLLEVDNLLLGETLVVVVDMLERRTSDVIQRLGSLGHIVDNLHKELAGIDIAILDIAQCGQDAIFALTGLEEEVIRLLNHIAQHLSILLEYGEDRTAIDASHLIHSCTHLLDAVNHHIHRG